MRAAAIVLACVLFGVVAAPGFGGAPAEIRRLPDTHYVLDWPGIRPPGAGPIVSVAEPTAVEMLRFEGSQFVVAPQSRSLFGDYVRVSAVADRTVIRLNGRIAVTLDSGEEWRFTPGWMRLRIDASDPVVVHFFVVPGS